MVPWVAEQGRLLIYFNILCGLNNYQVNGKHFITNKEPFVYLFDNFWLVEYFVFCFGIRPCGDGLGVG